MKNYKNKHTIFSLAILLVIAMFTYAFSVEYTTSQEEQEDRATLAYVANTMDSLSIDEVKDTAGSSAVKEEIAMLNERIEEITDNIEIVKNKCLATYYHDKFDGRYAADGSIFSNDELTAAHKTLPFGTRVRVTNLKNDKSVIVTITDRGPFVKNKEIDLSKKAFSSIGKLRRGNLRVKLEVVPDNYEELDDYVERRDALVELHFADQLDSIKNGVERFYL